jgi:hypothetical protein
MNERIKELALEARLGPALLLHHYGKVDALTDTEQEGLEQIEKFAELIVRECALTAGLMEHEGRPDIGAQILDNFGVE